MTSEQADDLKQEKEILQAKLGDDYLIAYESIIAMPADDYSSHYFFKVTKKVKE